MENTRRITIDITAVGEPCKLGMSVDYVKRTVYVDYEEVYSDRISVRKYSYLDESDPIRNLEISLLGLKKKQYREDSRTDSSKFVGFFKKIRRKMLAKIDFVVK
jgi:hypothetical protein